MRKYSFVVAAVVTAAFGLIASCSSSETAVPRGSGGAAGMSGSGPQGGNAGIAGGGGTSGGGGAACAPESDATFCTRLGKACGSATANDNCGASRTVAVCGTCTAPQACSATNVCGCASETDTAFCSRVGRNCGTVTANDNCGASRTVTSCGTCTAPDVCSAGNVCGPVNCVPETDTAFCTRTNKACGAVTDTDNCGTARTVASCGTCTPPQTCGATNACACTPEDSATFCTRLAKACGTVAAPDNCGVSRSVTSCGTCIAPQTCGGSGTPNVCGTGATGTGGAGGSGGGGGAGGTGGAGGSGGSGGVILPPVDGGTMVFPPGGFDGTTLDLGKHVVYNLDYDWQWIKSSPAGVEAPGFADTGAGWTTVSLPHTWNDIDQYDKYMKMGPGFGWTGTTWYRKHFKLPADQAGKKIFLDMEGARQIIKVYMNGTLIGQHNNGVGAAGFDLTANTRFGAEENVLAIMVCNQDGQYGAPAYNWTSPSFNPNYGGIIKNVWLHLTDKLYQTMPLYSNLGTQGVFVYPKNVDIAGKKADVVAEAEVANETGAAKNVIFGVVVYDMTGKQVASGAAQAVSLGPTTAPGVVLTASATITDAKFWEPAYPYVYRVATTLSVDGTLVDGVVNPFGAKTVTFSPTTGLLINGRFVWIDGYAQRSSNTIVAIGQGVNWVEEWDYLLMRDSRSVFVRPMHITPKKADVQAADKFGVVLAVPAGDGENQQPTQDRADLMRDSMIYMRNNPSVMFWESGNEGVEAAGMALMRGVYDKWIGQKSPTMIGSRSSTEPPVPGHMYNSSMDGTCTSASVPCWASEYSRPETPRRVWDAFSPMLKTDGTIAASGGYSAICAADNVANQKTYDPINNVDFGFYGNSMEDLALENTRRHYENWKLRGGPGVTRAMVGGAKIIFADCESHGRESGEVARASGAIDGARLPKESYYAMGAAHSPDPAIHILGHWNYAAGTTKPVFVIASASCEQIKMAVLDANGGVIKDYGVGARTVRNLFAVMYNNVAFQPGKIRAECLVGGAVKASQEKVTAGNVVGVKITANAGPENALRADGSDQGWFDIEAVDAKGVRNPVDNTKIDMTLSGAGIFRGGYNSGLEDSQKADNSPTQSLYIENGIQRVYVRATRQAGTITLTVKRAGLSDATGSMVTKQFDLVDGLTKVRPKGFAAPVQ
jgi:beta-galactosidase